MKKLTPLFALLLGLAVTFTFAQGTYMRSFDVNQNNVIDSVDPTLYAATAAAYYGANTGAMRWTPAPTRTPTRTATPTKTSTPNPTATNTPLPTLTPTVAPTLTPAPPTATAGGLAGQPCPDSVHAQYVVTGPDGNIYPTWHPNVDPATGCIFSHEHGKRSPAESLADPSMPAFGYIGAQAGMTEPHQGFKVMVINAGEINANEGGGPITYSARFVAHMGTSGAKRFVESMHSLEYDAVFPDGRIFHVQGMANTANAGHICERDGLNSDSNPNNNIGRTVVVIAGQGCDAALLSNYEIWTFALRIGSGAGDGGDPILNVEPALALFDPASYMDRSASPPVAVLNGQKGCRGDFYVGPHHQRNSFTGQSVFFTDTMGMVGMGLLRQEISQGTNVDGEVYKQLYNNCYAGLSIPN